MKLQWLGQVRFTLGALDAASAAQIKALLASFVATDGGNCVVGYGLQPGDIDPNAWATRDGQALVCFGTWWWTTNHTPTLPDPSLGPKPAHLQALLQWSAEKASAPAPVNCVLACQTKYATDPQNLATCLAICASTAPPPAPPPPAPPPPQSIPPLPPPPAPITQPSSSTSSSMGGWVVAGLLALAIGIGALALGGASPQRTK